MSFNDLNLTLLVDCNAVCTCANSGHAGVPLLHACLVGLSALGVPTLLEQNCNSTRRFVP